VLIAGIGDAPRGLKDAGASFIPCEEKNGKVSLPDLFRKLSAMNIDRLLVEGGPTLAAAACGERLVDRVRIYAAPILLGGQSANGMFPVPLAGSIKDADSALPDIEDLPDLDLELGGEASGEFASSDAVPEPTEELVPDFSDLPTFSLDEDEGTGLDEPGSDQLASTDGDESFSELSMDDFLEVDEEESESAPSTDEFISDPTANEEIALETVSDFDDFLNDLSDQSAPTPPPVEAESIDSMPELDIDLEMGDEEPQQIMSNDDISVDLSASDGQPETAAEKDASEEQFDDVAALGLEMAEPGRESPRSKPDLST